MDFSQYIVLESLTFFQKARDSSHWQRSSANSFFFNEWCFLFAQNNFVYQLLLHYSNFINDMKFKLLCLSEWPLFINLRSVMFEFIHIQPHSKRNVDAGSPVVEQFLFPQKTIEPRSPDVLRPFFTEFKGGHDPRSLEIARRTIFYFAQFISRQRFYYTISISLPDVRRQMTPVYHRASPTSHSSARQPRHSFYVFNARGTP